jgi:hypothetical protein
MRPQPTSARRHRPAVSGRFMATNDPNSAGCKRHDGGTSDSGCARPSHRSRRGSPVGPMSTASAEARAQCAARLRILHRPGRSPRRQRNPGDQDRCRAQPAGSERTENSRGDHVCSRSGSRASELMPPGLFGSTTIDCRKSKHPRDGRRNRGGRRLRACLENGAITDGRALGGNLRLIRSPRQRLLARANVVDRMSGSRLLWALGLVVF